MSQFQFSFQNVFKVLTRDPMTPLRPPPSKSKTYGVNAPPTPSTLVSYNNKDLLSTPVRFDLVPSPTSESCRMSPANQEEEEEHSVKLILVENRA